VVVPGCFAHFVSQLNPTGSALVYSTCLGGSGYDEDFGIAVYSIGNAYVIGATNSTDFPTMNPLQPVNGGSQFPVSAESGLVSRRPIPEQWRTDISRSKEYRVRS
jgi:hypothetical protein